MQRAPDFKQALSFWLKLGFISFGGPAGQIALMHTELVERRRWISEERFLHALNFCMLLPGPEAQQLATYIGWILHGIPGGLAAGILFVLPAALLLFGLSVLYVTFGQVPWMSAAFYGLKPAVVAIVLAALFRVGQRTLKGRSQLTVAILAFLALAFFRLPFPLVVLCALAFGLLKERSLFSAFRNIDGLSWRSAAGILAIGLVIWWTPILLAALMLGRQSTAFEQGLFFSKASMVTFGGAYAVLPYVAQQAVEKFHWLTTQQMLDGLGLAETTPGPLIIVLQFVAFLGGWHKPGALDPLAAATISAALCTWATFVPSFIWIFSAAPFVERLRTHLSGGLAVLGAAVTGVMLNLALWFSWKVLLPENHPDLFAIALAGLALVALLRLKWSVTVVVLASAVAGWLFSLR